MCLSLKVFRSMINTSNSIAFDCFWFPLLTLLYLSVYMPTINHIKYQREKMIKKYVFALFMFNKNLFLDNYLVFENLNIIQIDI